MIHPRRIPVPVRTLAAIVLAAATPVFWPGRARAQHEPVDVIFDTDIGNDIDDALALALLHALESRGECRLLAVTITKDHPLAAAYTAAVNRFYGRADIPIGVVRDGATSEQGTYLGLMAETVDGVARFPDAASDSAAAPEAVALLRKVLAERPDGSVVVIQVGFSTNLARLLESSADASSPLAGRDLVSRKVRLLAVMAGAFRPIDGNDRHREYNVITDLPAARRLAEAWPTPIVWSGFEVGNAVLFPARSIEEDHRWARHHPVAEAYRRYQPMPYDRPTWDLTSVLDAVRPDHGVFTRSPPGRVEIDPDGATRFVESAAGRDRILTVDATQASRAVEAFVNLCSQPGRSVHRETPAAVAVVDGPPTRYAPDVEHYRFRGTCNLADPAFYPVPRDAVTRDTYLRCVEAYDPAAIASQPDRGMDGPRVFMPVLVKYVQTGDKKWAAACIAMLEAFHAAMRRQVAERGWFWQFEHPPALLPLYRDCLVRGGAMTPDAAWFRELWLYYCRHVHVWDTAPVEWRGGCHRSMPEAFAKGRAAAWYPDIPEAAHWRRYADLVFDDFWRVKDVGQNDAHYMMMPLITLTWSADQWTGDDRVFTDPGMKRLWDRLMVEVSPDGAVVPYGPNAGWNATADFRIAMLERVAAKTGDGRYRFVAHKLLNQLRYQAGASGRDSFRLDDGSSWLISLAWLFADDSIAPVPPDTGSLWSRRGETARVSPENKPLIERLLGNADPRPDHGHICCGWFLTGNEWPDKLVLRSGWNPGDLFALVELHPTSFPANPGGIMGLCRWGAPFTQIAASKGATVENRLLVEDLGGKAARRLHPDPVRINEMWDGRPPDIRSEVTHFEDGPQATYAAVRVRNPDGLPVVYDREFVFVKNGFLACRETVTFEEAFPARVAAIWNTHNIGPQIGTHWANTFIAAPIDDNGNRSLETPPADLLVWFAPHGDRRMHVVDRLASDPRTEACPNQLRYAWEGEPPIGRRLVFTQVYYPHPPYRSRTLSNNPGAVGGYADDLEASAHAAGITVLRDDAEASILRLEMQPGRVEWVVFNPDGKQLTTEAFETSARMAYYVGDDAAAGPER